MPKTIKKVVKKSHKSENIGETVTDLREKLQEKQQTLVYSLFAFGVVLIAVVAFVVYSKVADSKAQALQYEGYRLFHGDTLAPSASPADQYKSALEKFKQSYEAKKSPVSLLYIADSCFALGNYDEAIKTLKDLTARYSDPKISSLGYYKLSLAYVKKDDKDNALKTLATLAGLKDSPLQDMALLESAKLMESMGKTAEAKAKYKELTDKFPKSILAVEAKAKLGG